MTSNKKKQGKAVSLPVTRLNAAGIDIGASQIFVAVPADRAADNIRSFPTFTADLYSLAQWLKECHIETVAMESTGVYWIPLFQILDDAGFEVFLVNARHVKNVPGRKTDVSDCQWLQFLHSVGLLRSSFRPAQEVCAIRSIIRHRKNLIELAATHTHHMQKALDQMNVQLHRVITDITGKTGLTIVDAILSGERSPNALAQLRDPGIKADQETVAKSLVGDYRPEHVFTLRQSVESYRYYQKLVASCDHEISRLLQQLNAHDPQHPDDAGGNNSADTNSMPDEGLLRTELKRAFGVDLSRVPGIGIGTVQTLFGEVGPDLRKFRSGTAFASWLTLCPDNDVSGGKVLRTKTRQATSRARTALRMAACSLHGSKSFLGEFYRRMRAKLGAPKAITATAHKLARIIYHMVVTGTEFDEGCLLAHHVHYQKRQEARLRTHAKALGYSLVPLQPAPA